MRRGFSVIELVTALVILGLVLALVVRSAVFHERFQRKTAAAGERARAAGQAASIVAGMLSSVSVGDFVVSGVADSALDLDALVGSGIGCLSGAVLRIGDGSTTGQSSAFLGTPRAGDTVLVFDEARRPPRWVAAALASVDAGGAPCPLLGDAAIQTLRLEGALDIGPHAAFRILRRTRLSLYRSGDGAWYLGMRDWNSRVGSFNAVQPAAGPLASYQRDRARTGLHFEFLDSLGSPVSISRALAGEARAMQVVARAAGGPDSAFRLIGLDRAR